MQKVKFLVALETALSTVYNEFCYNEQPAITSKYFSCEAIFVTDINVKKFRSQLTSVNTIFRYKRDLVCWHIISTYPEV